MVLFFEAIIYTNIHVVTLSNYIKVLGNKAFVVREVKGGQQRERETERDTLRQRR